MNLNLVGRPVLVVGGGRIAYRDNVPQPDDDPDFFVDYGETGPFSGEVGDSECAV